MTTQTDSCFPATRNSWAAFPIFGSVAPANLNDDRVLADLAPTAARRQDGETVEVPVENLLDGSAIESAT
jgi:hypothetical protein